MRKSGRTVRFSLRAENWTDEERRELASHIEEGYLQAERGELIDGAEARREIQAMKNHGRLSKR